MSETLIPIKSLNGHALADTFSREQIELIKANMTTDAPVTSVNGKTGAVQLEPSDIGAQPAGSYLTKETDPTVPAWAKEANPPSYTKGQVGLGNVDNTSDANKPVSTAQATAIADAKAAGTTAQTNLTTHTNNKSNPHGVDKSQVGLANVDNVKQYSASNPPPYPVSSVNGKTGEVSLSASDVKARPDTWTPTAADVGARPSTWTPGKSEVGLGNVDNVKQYSSSNPPPYPVTSVNGKTGAITLSAGDVSADAAGAATSAVNSHNSNTSAHADIRNQVNQLSAEIGGIVPDYVKTEATSVIERVSAAQTGRTFTFAAITDLHYGNGGYTDGILHACQALSYIDERLKMDAVAVLGDYTDGYPADSVENAFGDFRTINSVLNDLRFAPNLRMQGNHDYYANHAAEIRRHIQSYSEDVVWGSLSGGYYYKDFEPYKLRVIVLNTTETGNESISCTATQYQWFADSLDLTSKGNADEWQILVLSHHPIDWYYVDDSYAFAKIANAYRSGTAFSGSGVSCDFSNGKNAAVLVGNIHGHIHNLLVDNVHIGNVSNSAKTKVYRLATPEACYGRTNTYDGAWAESTSYPKTQNTADDTSFVIYCIDLDTYSIKAVCYGAGHDRELTYYVPGVGYTNQIPVSINADGSQFVGTNGEDGYKKGYRLNSSGTESASADYSVTGFMPCGKTSTVRLRDVNLPNNDTVGCYIAVYDASFAKLLSQKIISGMETGKGLTFTSGVLTEIDVKTFVSYYQSGVIDSVKYMRLSAKSITDDSIITVDEEIN